MPVQVTSVISTDHPAPDLCASEFPCFVWSVAHGSPDAGGWKRTLGTNQREPEPKVETTREGMVLVGADQSVFVLDGATGLVLLHVNDLSDVVQFLKMRDDSVLVNATDQLALFEPGGNLLWRQVFPDVIDDVRESTDGSQITVDAGGSEYKVQARTGSSAP